MIAESETAAVTPAKKIENNEPHQTPRRRHDNSPNEHDDDDNDIIQKYDLNDRYPFTKDQISVLLQLYRYFQRPRHHHSNSNDSATSMSTIVSNASLNTSYSPLSPSTKATARKSECKENDNATIQESEAGKDNNNNNNNNLKVCTKSNIHSNSNSNSNKSNSNSSNYNCNSYNNTSGNNHSVTPDNGKHDDDNDDNDGALKWIDLHLLIPYYSQSFFFDLIQCAKQHSHVFSNKQQHHLNFQNRNGDEYSAAAQEEDGEEEEARIHLFLEAMCGLTSRTAAGGPKFEIQILFEFILKHVETKNDSISNTATSATYNPTSTDSSKNRDAPIHHHQYHHINNNAINNHNDDENDHQSDTIQSNVTFDHDDMVDVELMIGLLYRLALACHVLQHWSSLTTTRTDIDNAGVDDDVDSDDGHDLHHIDMLGKVPPKIMIESLASYQVQDNNEASSFNFMDATSSFGVGGHNHDEECDDAQVNYETFRNWVELNFPQMACIVSTFLHLALFKDAATSTSSDFVDDNDLCSSSYSQEDEDEYQLSLVQYARGKRKIFAFPNLRQLVMTKSLLKNVITQKIIATPPSSSMLFDTQSYTDCNASNDTSSDTSSEYNNKGVTGHFAFGMACMDSNLCGKWYRLYSTETDGFAFLNMQKALAGYTGPTVMIVRPTKASAISGNNESSSPGLFGFYTSSPWKESKTFYGSSDCFLFRADPTWNVYRPKCFMQGWKTDHTIDNTSISLPLRKQKMTENYMYFNPSAGHVNLGTTGGFGMSSSSGVGYRPAKSGKPFGIAAGGTIDQPRFHITESFERCIASAGNMMDKTFESGPLLPGQWDKYFNIDVLEVWGVGGEDIVCGATLAKEKYENIAEATRKKVQRVDRKQFVDDLKYGFVNNRLFEHRFDGNVRYDFDANADYQDRCE